MKEVIQYLTINSIVGRHRWKDEDKTEKFRVRVRISRGKQPMLAQVDSDSYSHSRKSASVVQESKCPNGILATTLLQIFDPDILNVYPPSPNEPPTLHRMPC